MIIKKLFYFVITLLLLQTNPAFSMDVAVTVDDLPANGELPSGLTRAEIADKILAVLKKHHITGVYGLVNGAKVQDIPNGKGILQKWVDEGQLLGNHTYDHLDIAKTSSNEYISNIKKNEPVLTQLMGNKNYHFFRYPFLSEGNTQEKRDSVRKFLFQNNYQIVPVTVDFFEYEWNDPYVRCLEKNDKKSIEWLKKTYIEQANNALIISHSLSMMLFKRDIKNVLLIHVNSFTAEMLDTLLTSYENKHIKFISLNEALKDDVYQINPNIVRDRAYTFLNQVRLAREMQNPVIVDKLYATLPEDKLNNLCLGE